MIKELVDEMNKIEAVSRQTNYLDTRLSIVESDIASIQKEEKVTTLGQDLDDLENDFIELESKVDTLNIETIKDKILKGKSIKAIEKKLEGYKREFDIYTPKIQSRLDKIDRKLEGESEERKGKIKSMVESIIGNLSQKIVEIRESIQGIDIKSLQDKVKELDEKLINFNPQVYVQGLGSGVTKFTQLGDAPTSYDGQAGKVVKVNATEDGVEFGTVSGTGVVETIVAGTGISVDSTDPANPIVTATSSGTGDVVGPASATDGNIALYDGATGKLIKNSAYSPASFAPALTSDQNYVTDAELAIIAATTASFTTTDEAKLDNITVTQAVDLDQMEADIAALANGMVYKDNWDASAGTFPGSGAAQTGRFYTVSVGGTVDGEVFFVDDRLIATTDNASTTTYAGNWTKLDATDAVTSVNGMTGNVTGLATVTGVETLTNKTLTAPKFADLGFIADANGNEMLVFDTVAAAINHWKLTNASGTSVIFEADGDSANINVVVRGKGNGRVTIGTSTSTALVLAGNQPIEDNANRELVKFTQATTAVNEVTIGNAATGAGPSITATGDDTNIDLNLTAKGTGKIVANSTILLAESKSIELDGVLSADGTRSGITISATAGYTQAFGDLVYLDPTDSRREACDANAASGADGDCRGLIGMVVVAGTDGAACTILLQGTIRADANFPTLTVGSPVYASETAGDVVTTAPSTSGAVVRVLGSALTADSMYFNPSGDFIVNV